MKGVVLADGQAVPTPVVSKLRQLLTESPSKRIDLINVLDRNQTNPPTFPGALARELDDQYEEKENAPPDASSVPSSPSSASSDSPHEKTPQPKQKRRSSTRIKTLPTWNPSPSADDLVSQLQADAVRAKVLPPHVGGMHRTASAPALWAPEDDDDLPSPFLKRTDRAATSKAAGAPVTKGLALDKKPSKTLLKQDANGTSRSVPKATGIKPSTSRTSLGKPVARTMSSKP
ncbi:hypothetical protein M408DRAFT_289950 [Serendipita vermifera MAFF 305830]|uniref:Uncharacterized protein n=1 Tax=Serendipita vermifera MAFF 305830 TaxID=933852 RepID=A0A0C3BGX4_SERVB|nr:hypothetical protein M408DRAFT_289950 [Serendipita vermifera MAFF 305830]